MRRLPVRLQRHCGAGQFRPPAQHPVSCLMISLEEAEKQADKLKVEIETLTESLAQERARADTLRALADAGIKEKIYRTSGNVGLRAELETLKAATVGVYEAVTHFQLIRLNQDSTYTLDSCSCSNPAPVSSISSPPAWSAESFVPTKGARTESSPTSTHRSGPQMASILIESTTTDSLILSGV
ncbi:hypothetical protein B0H14DRAFT_3620533 [Mycena olivaceomarginata]|nr:hypothetical protein B0H14DRAFT_3620533 [Mycena olivaceomarginata]